MMVCLHGCHVAVRFVFVFETILQCLVVVLQSPTSRCMCVCVVCCVYICILYFSLFIFITDISGSIITRTLAQTVHTVSSISMCSMDRFQRLIILILFVLCLAHNLIYSVSQSVIWIMMLRSLSVCTIRIEMTAMTIVIDAFRTNRIILIIIYIRNEK